MKIALVTIAGISAISYEVPSSLEELKNILTPDQKKAEEIACNAAVQYYLQTNLINVRNKIAEYLSKKFEINLKSFVGNVEVICTVDNDGKINGYKAVEGKKTFKATEKVKQESAKDFIDRVISEKALTQDEVKKIVQKIANANPFKAEQKRVRGSVASKPVGKKWLTLAEKIIANGNGDKAAERVKLAIGRKPDITGDDGVKRLAIGLAEEARLALAKLEAESDTMAGTEETPLVVAGTK
jgi:hypothetical protein